MGFFGHPELRLDVFYLIQKKTNDMGYGFLPYPKKNRFDEIHVPKKTNLTISCTKKNQFARFHVPKKTHDLGDGFLPYPKKNPMCPISYTKKNQLVLFWIR